MLSEWALFLALSAVALGGAAMMLLTMSMYRAGLFLMVSFLALAGMFFLLQADLLAAIQIMMNVGGMAVMILFMVMLMIDPGGEMMWDMKRQMKLPGPGAFSMSMPRGSAPPPPDHMADSERRGSPAAGETEYTCPMHPEVISDAPGPCPKCGMDLVPIQDQIGTGPAEPPRAEHPDTVREYTCPMHPEARSDAPGPCPICGMQLVPVAPEDTDPAQAAVEGEYTCPMHPEIVSGEPGKCPKCGMDLVPTASPAGTEPTEGMPGPGGEHTDAYTCPMHPDIRSDRPGPCPKCGMDLVPAHGSTATPAGTGEDAQDADGYTCPMHPEVRSDEPGSCPKCGMDLVPVGNRSPSMAPEGDTASMHGGHAMSPAAHHQMMVDMAMSTEQLPWALGIGLLSGGSLAALVAWTPWRPVPRGPVGDAASAVGELLLTRYMIAFEGAAMLILAGVAGGVILGRRENRASHAGSDSTDGALVHPHARETTMENTNDRQTQGSSSVWTCPMHPEVRSDGPGKCPKCGMNLVPAESLGSQGEPSGR